MSHPFQSSTGVGDYEGVEDGQLKIQKKHREGVETSERSGKIDNKLQV